MSTQDVHVVWWLGSAALYLLQDLCCSAGPFNVLLLQQHYGLAWVFAVVLSLPGGGSHFQHCA